MVCVAVVVCCVVYAVWRLVFAKSCWFVGWLVFVVRCDVFVVRCVLVVVRCSLCVVRRLLFAVHIVCCVLVVGCLRCLLIVVCCVLLLFVVVCCLLVCLCGVRCNCRRVLCCMVIVVRMFVARCLSSVV